MEEKTLERIEKHNKSKLGLSTILALCLLVVAVVLFITSGVIIKLKPDSSSNNVENSTVSLVKEMFGNGIELLYGYSGYSTSIDNYISSDESDSCSYGMGCMMITNWYDNNYMFTDNLIKNLNDENDYSVVIIEDEPYLKDGLGGIGLEKISDVKIISETKEEIQATVSAVLIMYDKGIVTDDKGNSTNARENKSTNMTIIKENNSWKIDSFKIV